MVYCEHSGSSLQELYILRAGQGGMNISLRPYRPSFQEFIHNNGTVL